MQLTSGYLSPTHTAWWWNDHIEIIQKSSILQPHVGVIWCYIRTYFVEALNFPIVFVGLNLPNCTHEPTINQPSTNHRPDFPAVQPLLFRFSTKGGDPCGITNRASQQFIEWSATTGAFNNRINNLNMFKWMDIYVYIYIFMLLGLWMTDVNWTNMEQY